MSGFDQNSERRVLPLWRSASSAARSWELQPLPSAQRASTVLQPSVSDLDEILQDFKAAPSIGLAADAINSAILSDRRDEAKAPAAFILKSDHIPRTLCQLAQKIVGEVEEAPAELDLAAKSRPNIRHLRHLLTIDPRSSVLLVDLAREYAGVGKIEAANRAIQTALTYGGRDRWVSRMAARFFVHSGKKDKAHYLIANHPLVRSDPWMLAAEIAIAHASGKAPVHWKRAKNLLEGSLSPKHLTELACAVGTLEMESGANRKARKYFAQAVEMPTANSLAQLKWAERHLKTSFQTDQKLGGNKGAFEAKFWASYYRTDIANAKKFATQWLAQEPFSKRPAIMLSFVCSLLDDHELSLEAAKWGLRANPEDVTLRLNKYFSEISAGWNNDAPQANVLEQERLEKELIAMIRNRNEPQHALANLGLLLYRQGRYWEGRAAYDVAASTTNKNHDELSAASAKVFHAREAVFNRCEWAPEVVAEAKSSAEKIVSPGLKFYLAKIEMALKYPEKIDAIFTKTSELNNQDVPDIEFVSPMMAPKIDFEIKPSGATIWLPSQHKSKQ